MAALLLSLQTLWYAGRASCFHPYLPVVFSGALIIYNLPFIGLKNSIPFKVQWARCKVRFSLCLLSLFVFLMAFIYLTPGEQILCFTGAVIALAYKMPLLVRGKKLKGLRYVPGAKSFFLAGGWTLATAVIPLVIIRDQVTATDLLLIALKRFSFIFALCLLFDIRDLQSDSLRKIKTIPVLFGVRNTKNLATASILVFAVLAFLHHALSVSGVCQPRNFMVPLLGSAVWMAPVIFFANSRRSASFFSRYVDGAMIFQFAMITGFSLFNFF